MTAIEQIQEKYHFLTRKQREVADYILEDAERMSYITLKEMSQETGITEMTILKTCSLLGFPSFSALKYEFRKYLTQQIEFYRHQTIDYSVPPTPDYDLNDIHSTLREICDEEARLHQVFFQQLNIEQILAAADMILSAENVILCGRGVSTYVCDYFAMCLAVLDRGALCINSELEDSIHAALPLMTENTLLIAVSFPDYYRMTTKVAEYAHRKGIRVLGLTDMGKSPIISLCDITLTVPTNTRLFPNSIGTVMSFVNILASAMNLRLSAKDENFNQCTTEFYDLFPER